MIERQKRKLNGELIETHRYVMTFNKPELPRTIKITDWHHELIELYIPKPMFCFNCQKLGHTKKRCRRQNPVCSRCSQEGHQARDCNNPTKCNNCSGNHKSVDKKCPTYEFKAEVLATQARTKLTFREAEDKVKEQYHKDGKTYSFAVRQGQQSGTQNSPQRPSNVAATGQQHQETEVTRPSTTLGNTSQVPKDSSTS